MLNIDMKYRILRAIRDNSGMPHQSGEDLTFISTCKDSIRGTLIRCSFDDGAVMSFEDKDVGTLIIPIN